jgi:hypothetical protein
MEKRTIIIISLGIVLLLVIAGTAFLYYKNIILTQERNALCSLSNTLIVGINADSYVLYSINTQLAENRTLLNQLNCSERLNLN